MERACPACGAPLTITRYHTALRCPWCHNTLYPTPVDSLLFYQVPPVLSPARAEQALRRVLKSRGVPPGTLTLTSRSSLTLPFMKTTRGTWRSCGEETFFELEGYIPRADEILPLDPEKAPPVHLGPGDSADALYLIPFTLFSGQLEDRPVRFIMDNVTGELYSADFPDHLSRRRIRRNRMTLLALIVSSFLLTFFAMGTPLLLLLSLIALFFLGLALLKGG